MAAEVFDPARHPHRRRNPLTGDWVVVSPQRTARPWHGATDRPQTEVPTYDPHCYLCPGNERAGGVRNPHYDATFVFENDFAALLPGAPAPDEPGSDDLFATGPAAGECRVICFSPRHDLTLATMDVAGVATVVRLWREQLTALSARWEWVQLFETRGAISGASNPHPHGQIWASAYLPNEAVREVATQREHHERTGRVLLVEYASRESDDGSRTVAENDDWIVVVPYWAYWPFETLVLPRRPVASLTGLDDGECRSLAEVLSSMLRAFDRLFDTPFPYCSGWHNAPSSGAPGFQLHAHYYPPLLRSAEVAKIPASYELLANLQRDLTPEIAAERLRSVS